MKRVFTSGMFLTLSLLLIGAQSTGAAGTPAALPGDTDKDGTISCNEAKQMATNRFNRADANKDKSMTLSEFKALTAKNFEAMDTNKNGTVDVKEYVVYWCGARSKDVKTSKKATLGGTQSLHRQMDLDGNVKVTRDECMVHWTARFAHIDENKDDSITKGEFGKKVVEWHSAANANKDDSVTFTEYIDYWVGTCEPKKMKKARGAQ